jgi:endonuclease G, mitochondrial
MLTSLRKLLKHKLFYFSIIIVVLVAGCINLFPTNTNVGNHLLLGNPSQATNNPSNANNYLMERPQYILSYNRERGTANWVSWQLNKSWLGSIDRQDDFRADDDLPQGWDKITPKDYSNSGYDRGHLAPSADRTNSVANNSATFLMTNIIPQAPDNNRGPWSELEQYSRSLVDQGKELYIIAGGSGKKGSIAKGQMTVPKETWKIILVLDQPGAGIQGISNNTRVIAVSMPNNQGIKTKNWQSFRVSVDQLEKTTGYDFLSAVDANTQKSLESKVDMVP